MAIPSPRTLLGLPRELLHAICNHLNDKSSRLYLKAFSLACKACYTSASKVSFRSIRLNIRHQRNGHPVNTPAGIQALIAEWRTLLDRRGAYRYVQELRITEKHDPDDPGPFASAPYPSHTDTWDYAEEFTESPRRSLNTPADLYQRKAEPKEEMLSWMELEELIRALPALLDLYWDCSWPIARRLEDTVLSRPAVNLHLNTFWFADGYDGGGLQRPQLSRILMQSQLKSIGARSVGHSYYSHEDYTHEAILDVVTGMNPAVRHLSLLSETDSIGQPLLFMAKYREYRRPWMGFADSKRPFTGAAPLVSLEVGGDLAMNVDFFESVFRRCDLSDLRTLKLRTPYTYTGLEWITYQANLPSLKVLVIGSLHTSFPESELGDENLVATLLNSLPPLDATRFIGDIDEGIFESLLRRHGSSLRRLWFPPPEEKSAVFFNAQRMAELQHACLILEDLDMPIPRSQGDAAEVRMYRSLGQLSRLKRLSLTLDCEDVTLDLRAQNFDPTPAPTDSDDFDMEFLDTPGIQGVYSAGEGRKPRRGHLRQAMTNAALDKTLALSIFETVSNAKPGHSTDLRLERLELRPVRGIYLKEADEVIHHLSKWWSVEVQCDPRGTCAPIATRMRSMGDWDEENWGQPEAQLNDQIESVFRKVWPRTSAESGWSDDWSSLPLAL